uniref:Phosphatidylinositol-glycan biosynthesis class W protein n=1 Tax=Spongospora subterranea TaxID=70186 RepID=A0A0H5QQW3_9EUKA|eukprot:CRZ04470.1 hypothetical protein [Spongospora subterranea]
MQLTDAASEYEIDHGRMRFLRRYPMGSEQYKLQKERFVSESSGCALIEVTLLCLIVATSIISHHSLRSSIFRQKRPSQFLHIFDFFLEFLMCPCVIVISMLYPEYLATIFISQLVISASSFLFISDSTSTVALQKAMNSPRLRFVTWFRSAFMVCTCCAILAVDFPLFPRRFVKTETFGTSLMDTGVGFVVFSSGLVSKQSRYQTRSSFLSVVKSTSPMLILGVVRYASVSAVDYQTHVSEYGVHWNFFFTLTATSLMSHVLHPVIKRISVLGCALVVSGISQFVMSQHMDFLLNSPRATLFSANREGIFSSFGYFSIYLIGVDIGARFLHQKSIRSWWLTVLTLATCSSLCFLLVTLLGTDSVSRRFTNFPFVIWTVSFCTGALAILLSYDLVSSHENDFKPILSGIAKNQLFIFLGANLATGAVNLTMQTLYAKDAMSVIIMTFYILLVSSIAALMNYFNISLKFW